MDADLLRHGLNYWQERSEFVIVEGAGGLMSPLTDEEYVCDLALDCDYSLVVVAHNKIGVISQVLQTMLTSWRPSVDLWVAAVVLNSVIPPVTIPAWPPTATSWRSGAMDR